mgnify:FL=1
MFTYEEYSKANALGSLMTGTIIGFLKWSDMDEKTKRHLAKQLLWCYEHSGQTMSDSIKKDIEEILG